MQDALHPNRLKELLDFTGLTQREVAQESLIAYRTLRRYANGEQTIPRVDRIKLAHIIGCEVQDLAPQYEQKDRVKRLEAACMVDENKPSLVEEWDGCFSFGKIKTTSMVLDGDGEEVYLPANIHTHYDPRPATFFDEVIQAKRQIQLEEQQKDGTQWNSEKYHLSRIVVSRESVHEHMTLDLWFKPRDHYVGLATRRCLDIPEFRKKYLADDWYTPIVGMSMSMGVDMIVVSADGYVLLTQRGLNQSVHRGFYNCSVSEAVSPLLDRSTTSQAPDLYRCACRGFAEEMGLQESVDFARSEIKFLSFTVDTRYALYGLRGMVRVKKNAEDILSDWHAGVKDKRENKNIFIVPFTPEEVCTFVFSHAPFAPGGLVCLYHSLVHEFGRAAVDSAIRGRQQS